MAERPTPFGQPRTETHRHLKPSPPETHEQKTTNATTWSSPLKAAGPSAISDPTRSNTISIHNSTCSTHSGSNRRQSTPRLLQQLPTAAFAAHLAEIRCLHDRARRPLRQPPGALRRTAAHQHLLQNPAAVLRLPVRTSSHTSTPERPPRRPHDATRPRVGGPSERAAIAAGVDGQGSSGREALAGLARVSASGAARASGSGGGIGPYRSGDSGDRKSTRLNSSHAD